MIFNSNKYKRLIIKYLLGEATDVEQKLVEEWIAKSSHNKQLFESYRGLLFLTQKKKVEVNTDKAWTKVKAHILANQPNSITPKVYIKPKRQTIAKFAASGIAAMLVLTIGILSIVKEEKSQTLKYVTSYEISQANSLPDGSEVILNQRTSLKFPDKFGKDIREVSIFGEAFFEVKPDPDKPFVIHASGLDIKVLGTSFNVEAYPGVDYVKVTVSTGKVLVYPSDTPPGKETEVGKLLTAGEIATYSQKSGVIFKGVNDDLNVLSWKTGVLTFKEARLADVLKAFEEKYQKQFIVNDPSILNQRLTARFENQSIDDALETLSLIFNLEFENKGSYFMVH